MLSTLIEDAGQTRAEQTYARFIKDVATAVGRDRTTAQLAAEAVLHTLTRRLSADCARHLQAQLPTVLRDRLATRRSSCTWATRFNWSVFISFVAEELDMTSRAAREIIRAVFRAIQLHITEGLVDHVARELPEDIAAVWRHPA
jgi:uncharacterized protein (DUF2267 family)